MASIDLNADLGEGMGSDAALLKIVSSASIACGGHAGNADTMRIAVAGAVANKVTIGAHPGFVDPKHFGRRRLDVPTDVLADQIRAQVAALQQLAEQEGGIVRYVKLHGALANMAAEDEALARALFAAVRAEDRSLAVLALDNSAQVSAAEALGLAVVREAYADRAYTPEGLLVSRAERGAVIEEPNAVIAQCRRLAKHGEIVAIDGSVIRSRARSICLHGDTPGAIALAGAIRTALATDGIEVASAL